jgi:hypothetical protein
MNFKQLEDKIKNAFESGVTLDEAERLASEFLYAQSQIAEALRVQDLDARMRKSGLKAVKAAVYLDEASKTDKKPSDVMLQARVDMNDLVSSEQKSFDQAEVDVEYLHNLFSICKEAHVHFRGIAKGRFDG